MNSFHINIPDEEFESVALYLETTLVPISVYKMAKALKKNENHLRYIIDELVKRGRIAKVVVDDRPHHKRYVYCKP